MPTVTILPHETICPEGKTLELEPGDNLLEKALQAHIPIEHACERVCACTTCHVIVKEGYQSLEEPEEREDDLLDKAWGLSPNSRLSCQVVVQDADLTVEIPKYSINHAKEEH